MSDIQDLTKIGTIDDIVRSLDILDEAGLRETLAYIIKTYVIDGGLKTSGVENRQASFDAQTRDARVPVNYSDFKELIQDCKKMYNFPELKKFTVEANTLYVNLDGEKHVFEEKADESSGDSRPAPAQQQSEPRSAPDSQQQPRDNSGSGSGRFSNLEID